MPNSIATALLLALAALGLPLRAQENPLSGPGGYQSLVTPALWGFLLAPGVPSPILGELNISLFKEQGRAHGSPVLDLPRRPYGRSFFARLDADAYLLAADPARTGPPPLSPGGKFKLAMKRTFYPVPVVAAAAGAGWAMLVDSELDEGFGMGADGFARRWVFRLAFNGTKQTVGTFALASALKQDPRYVPSRKRGLWPRVWYALTRTVVTRSDAGEPQFNASLVLGTAAAAAASVGYVRDQDSSGGEAARRFGLSLALSAAKNVFREFFTGGD